MARERIDASLDAFDALIADLADAGEVARSEVTALRRQADIPQTREIPVQADLRWAVGPVPGAAAAVPPAREGAGLPPAPPAAPAQPMSRREARALREAQERQAQPSGQNAAPTEFDAMNELFAAAPEAARAASSPAAEAMVEFAVEAENFRRTDDQIHSHRVRPADFDAKPPVVIAAPKRKGGSVRRTLAAGLGAIVLIPSLWLVVPATADETPGPATVDSHGRTAQQILDISPDVKSPTVQNADYLATAIAAIVAKVGGASAEAAAPAIVNALSAGGNRATIIETALSYIGTPYVLDGSSHTGIDCSGLTMVSYAAIGIDMYHGVGAQDRLGTRIPQSEAKPGDVVVFNNEDHIGIYLGDNEVLAAPAPGRRVSIESVDIWRPVGIHFTRILPAGE